ncbi:hypothetical protein [Psychrobacter urativorans]|uniref:Uncharacterized protein n=1 Tax=Psychrobacter urativorans TaxID=45610 RepID=A0A0M3V8Q4_9GAMM|nr:hypothetical protein [Psychrobacter urativorans]ALF59307.1 hypothetical protein AOC03_03950 [Psychrobacter urativorans]
MSTIIIWVVGAGLLIINIMLRTRMLRLEAALKQVRSAEYMTYLRQLPEQNDKIAAIKALRKQYFELSLLDANKLWQQK